MPNVRRLYCRNLAKPQSVSGKPKKRSYSGTRHSNMKQNENLETSLISALGSDSIELTTNLSELALDEFLDDGFLKNVPVFSILYGSFKAYKGIRDAIFAMKIYRFLKDFQKIKDENTNLLISSISRSETERLKVGQTLIMVLDRIDDLDKTQIIANLFMAYLKKHLTVQEFTHLSSITQNVFITHLQNFCTINDVRNLRPDVESYLSNSGLLLPFVSDFRSMYGDKVVIEKNDYLLLYNISPIGSKMRKYAFDGKASR